MRFNEATTKGGRDALGWYHEKRDEARGIGLGPEHDFASHGADAFGLLAVFKAAMPSGDEWGAPLRRNLRGVL
jgi:phage terminase large subunit